MRTQPVLTVKQLTTIIADLASVDGENAVYDAALMQILYDVNVAGGQIELSSVIYACEPIAARAGHDEAKRAAFEVTRDALGVADAWSDRESLLELLLREEMPD